MSVIVVACEKKFWQDTLEELQKLGVEVSHTVAHYFKKTQPRYFFENNSIKIIDGKQFFKLTDLKRLNKNYFDNDFVALDKEIINFFEPVERDFYILTDRYCFIPLSFRRRKRLFREGLRFFITFYRKNNITQLFTTCSPHSFADYLAYHAAKFCNIPVLQTCHTMINDHVLLRHDYREEEKVPPNFLAGKNDDQIKQEIPPLLFESAFSESRVLQHVISQNQVSQNLKTIAPDHTAKAKKTFKRLLANFGKSPAFKGGIAMNNLNSKLARRVLRFMDMKWQKEQNNYYNAKAIIPEPGEKFIYFAMHLQPERTSTPEAGIFEDHLLAIQILAKSLPDGWKLYVKENPRQFDRINILKGRHHRDKSDFNDILKLPNTHLLCQKITLKELMQKAQIISTLSGSVGWEALKNGKPCMTFAPTWYSACQSCFKIEDVEECRAAINAMVLKTSADVHSDILKYLAFMKDKFSIGNLGDEAYLKNLNLTYEQHITSLAKSIKLDLDTISSIKSDK